MNYNPHKAPQYSTYPGEYTPIPSDINEVLEDLSKSRSDNIEPLSNIIDYPDFVKVELYTPGAKREEILVSINDHILTIIVPKHKEESHEVSYQTHQFALSSIYKQIQLPQNIDADFIKAEYTDGVLTFFFPKTPGYVRTRLGRIAVY